MVSRRPPNPVRKGRPAQIPALHSPLEKTPHKAAVIRDGGTMPATGALIEMTAECGRTTPPNGQQHFDVLPTEPVAISFDESISRGADQIGHLEWWPGHLLFLRRTAFERQRIQRTRGRMQVTLGEMQIAGRLFQIVMT